MNRFLLASLAGGSFLAALGPASAQDCTVMTSAQQQERLAAASLGATDRRYISSDIDTLRNAATLLDGYGQTEACASVATAIAAIVANPTIIQDETRAAFLAAGPLTGGRALAATDLLDRPLTALNGREVGKIEDLWLDTSNEVSLVLVALRGALGIGSTHIAVPIGLVHVDAGEKLYLGLLTEQLENAPRLDDRTLLTNESWRSQNDGFYTPILASLAQ
ncbi:MAG: PRC-barrel domain-containing protein [Bauldia sp.]|nr:PRC-barrel domain-containing protein [Bauldia sp.]